MNEYDDAVLEFLSCYLFLSVGSSSISSTATSTYIITDRFLIDLTKCALLPPPPPPSSSLSSSSFHSRTNNNESQQINLLTITLEYWTHAVLQRYIPRSVVVVNDDDDDDTTNITKTNTNTYNNDKQQRIIIELEKWARDLVLAGMMTTLTSPNTPEKNTDDDNEKYSNPSIRNNALELAGVLSRKYNTFHFFSDTNNNNNKKIDNDINIGTDYHGMDWLLDNTNNEIDNEVQLPTTKSTSSTATTSTSNLCAMVSLAAGELRIILGGELTKNMMTMEINNCSTSTSRTTISSSNGGNNGATMIANRCIDILLAAIDASIGASNFLEQQEDDNNEKEEEKSRTPSPLSSSDYSRAAIVLAMEPSAILNIRQSLEDAADSSTQFLEGFYNNNNINYDGGGGSSIGDNGNGKEEWKVICRRFLNVYLPEIDQE